MIVKMKVKLKLVLVREGFCVILCV